MASEIAPDSCGDAVPSIEHVLGAIRIEPHRTAHRASRHRPTARRPRGHHTAPRRNAYLGRPKRALPTGDSPPGLCDHSVGSEEAKRAGKSEAPLKLLSFGM